jgi:hypothetical protein
MTRWIVHGLERRAPKRAKWEVVRFGGNQIRGGERNRPKRTFWDRVQHSRARGGSGRARESEQGEDAGDEVLARDVEERHHIVRKRSVL